MSNSPTNPSNSSNQDAPNSPCPPFYDATSLQPHSDFELPSLNPTNGSPARRRSTAGNHDNAQPRRKPDFILPELPKSAKQGRPTLVREISSSSGFPTPAQTPYTQTPISTRPPSPAPLIDLGEKGEDHGFEETKREGGHGPEVGTIKSWRGAMVLLVTCGAQFLDNVYMTSSNISAPSIATALKVETAGELQWLISAYTLALGGFLLLAGVLSDRYGRKNIFSVGMAWLSVWTLACGFANQFITLAIFRALQGMGAAMTVPSAVGIISSYFVAEDRTKALSLFGASGAVGFSMGLIIGGLVTSSLGWRFVFYITVTVTGSLALLGILILPKDRFNTLGSRPRLDFFGAAVSTAGLILLSFVLSSGGEYGWKTGFIIALLIVSVAMLVGFTFVEKKVKNPIMPLSVWKLPNFAGIWITSFVLYGGYQTVIYYITLIAQEVYHLSARDTALRLLPMGATGFVGSWAMGHIVGSKMDIKHLLIAGMVVCTIAPIPAALTTAEDLSFWKQVFPSSVLSVLGVAIGYNVVSVVTLASVPMNAKSLAGGMLNCAFQIGSGVGLAIASAVVTAVDEKKGHSQLQGYTTGLWCCVGLGALGLGTVIVGVKGQKGVSHAEGGAVLH